MEDQKKTLGKLKLNQLNKSELEKREMKVLKGGGAPGCSCGGFNYSISYWKT